MIYELIKYYQNIYTNKTICLFYILLYSYLTKQQRTLRELFLVRTTKKCGST